MSNSSIKIRRHFRLPTSSYRLETGFSMLEAVVVVGVLLALAVGGFFAYGPIAENAKIAKVKSAAAEIHTGVLVASMDGDVATTPQKVIDDWNASTNKIRVEILETGSELAAMTTAAPAQSANGDFCVQATNVESTHIKARSGACPAEGSGSSSDSDSDGIPNESDTTPNGEVTPAPLPGRGDVDGDGAPNSSDPDIDGDGTLNGSDSTPNGEGSVQDLSGPDKGDGTSAATVGTISGDGSGSFNDAHGAYGHAHEPVSPNIVPAGAVELTGWRFDKAVPRDINITFWADGNPHGGTGGNYNVTGHVDLTCYQPMNNTITERDRYYSVMMQEPYSVNVPGPHSNTALVRCNSGETVLKAVFRPTTEATWISNSSQSFSLTRLVTEGWVNTSFKSGVFVP